MRSRPLRWDDKGQLVSLLHDLFPPNNEATEKECAMVIAAPQVEMEKVQVNGTGCPSDSIQHTIRAEDGVMEITFSKYTASGYYSREGCMLALLVKVPAHYQIAWKRVGHAGKLALRPGVKARFYSVYTVENGRHGIRSFAKAERWEAPLEEDYQLNYDFAQVWGGCGKSTPLKASTYLSLGGRPTRENYFSAAHMTLEYEWKECR